MRVVEGYFSWELKMGHTLCSGKLLLYLCFLAWN